MAQARIVTDSTAELDPAVAAELQISVIPVEIRFRNETLRDGPDLRSSDSLREIAEGAPAPTVQAPPAATFREVYTRLMRETDDIVSIHVGRLPVNTLRPARAAAETLLGRARIEVLDSSFLSVATGMIVEEAARAALAGADGAEVVRLVRGLVPRVYLAFFVENVAYMKRSGALQASAASGGSGASRPLFIMEEGEIAPQFRVRNKGSVLERLVDFAAEFTRLQRLVVLHSGLMPEIEGLYQQLDERLGRKEVPAHLYGLATAAAIGPKALGLVAMEA